MKHSHYFFLALAALTFVACNRPDVETEVPDWYYTGGKLGTTTTLTLNY